jgi:MYXO-CTERM domain-containing protein
VDAAPDVGTMDSAGERPTAVDAGSDVARPIDAPIADASSSPDAGKASGGDGCGCRVGGATRPSFFSALVLLASAFVARRSRRSRR